MVGLYILEPTKNPKTPIPQLISWMWWFRWRDSIDYIRISKQSNPFMDHGHHSHTYNVLPCFSSLERWLLRDFWQKTEYPDLSHGCRDLNEEIRSILQSNPFMARTAFTAGEQLEVTRQTGSVVQCRARCGHGESFSLASNQFLKFFYKMNSFL